MLSEISFADNQEEGLSPSAQIFKTLAAYLSCLADLTSTPSNFCGRMNKEIGKEEREIS